MKWALAVGIALAASTASARPGFPGFLPNGTVIDGQGCQNCHVSVVGGGARNAFGNAISLGGLAWNVAICNADSDGDGQTNGFELGDPDCVWTQGAVPSRIVAISNPGRSGSLSGNTAPSWLCPDEYRGDGSCDCGCGVLDTDCADAQQASCDYNDCNESHPVGGFTKIDPADPTQCVDANGNVAEGEGEGGEGEGEGEGEGTAPSPAPSGCAATPAASLVAWSAFVALLRARARAGARARARSRSR